MVAWIPGLWMGLFWIGLGIFILVSSWFGRSSFPIPKLNISLGWVILVLGGLRIWWWWKAEELPKRRKQEFREEMRQMELMELQAQREAFEQQEEAGDNQDPSDAANKDPNEDANKDADEDPDADKDPDEPQAGTSS